MKTTEMIKTIENIFATCTEKEKKQAEKDLFNKQIVYSNVLLLQLLEELKGELFKEQTKSTAPGRYAAIKRIFSAKGNRPAARRPVHIDNSYMVTDGIHFVKIDDLVEMPYSTDDESSAAYIRKANAVVNNYTYDKTLELPDIAELKAYIKREKKNGNKGTIRYKFGKDQPMVNAEFLVNMLEIFPDAVCKYHDIISPVYFEQDHENYGVVMPLIQNTEDIAAAGRTELE